MGGGGSWVGVGAQKRGGGVGAIVGGGGRSTVGGLQNSKNLSSHHKYKSAKQFELKQNWKALRALNGRRALSFYPIFEVEMSIGSDEKLFKRKIALKKDRQD